MMFTVCVLHSCDLIFIKYILLLLLLLWRCCSVISKWINEFLFLFECGGGVREKYPLHTSGLRCITCYVYPMSHLNEMLKSNFNCFNDVHVVYCTINYWFDVRSHSGFVFFYCFFFRNIFVPKWHNYNLNQSNQEKKNAREYGGGDIENDSDNLHGVYG